MDEELTITSYDTIKGKYFNEVSINKFFKKIKSGINHFSKIAKRNEMDMDICYDANVYKLGENSYRVMIIRDYDYEKYNYDYYHINTSKFPQYAKVLDEYAKITSVNEYEKECYKKLESNEVGTTEENAMCLRYLKKLKKGTNKTTLLKVLSILSLPVSIGMLALGIHQNMPFVSGVFAFETISSFGRLFKGLIGDYSSASGVYYSYVDSVFASTKRGSLIGRRIKQVDKKLGDRQGIYNDSNNISMTKEELYKDAVINYMDNIMNTANKLNPEDRTRVLHELNGILDEYTSKSREINNDDGLGLSLSGGKMQVVKETINKLTTLQMELADLIKRDDKNRVLLTENDKFKEAINSSIREAERAKFVESFGGSAMAVEEGKKRTLTRGR